MARLVAAHLPSSAWSPAEAGAFRVLRELAPMWVTGGWVRDKLLECTDVNPEANREWQHLRTLSGYPPGDLDVLVHGVTARDFFATCRSTEALRQVLRGPPVLVEARGSRALDTVKLRLPEHDVDVTSLLDAQQIRGAGSGDSAGSDAKCQSGDAMQALLEDAEHRDTTFNACYYDLASEEVLDPSDCGMADLRAGLVRVPHPGGAAASVQEDPVRLLRAYRFAARLGFAVDDDLGYLAHLPAREGAPAASLSEELGRTPPGRLLFEAKKALLLHNRPSRFLGLLNGPGETHAHLFGAAGDALMGAWPAAVGRVRRLEAFVLAGVDSGVLTARSAHWRGRRPDGAQAALLAPDWRKTGVWESDWAELLLAALFWRCDTGSIKRAGGRWQLSSAMVDNVTNLQAQARQKLISPQSVPLGVFMLNAAVASGESPQAFWDRCPLPRATKLG